MSERMSEAEFLEYFQTKLHIPVWIRIPAENLTSISIFESLQKKHERAFLLDSAESGRETGRFSFMGFDPFFHFEARGQDIIIEEGDQDTVFQADPIKTLRVNLKNHEAVPLGSHPALVGGAVGYFSYDFIRLKENIPDRHSDVTNYPDMMFNFYKNVISYDHVEKTICIYSNVKSEGDPTKLYHSAIREVQMIITEMTISSNAKKRKALTRQEVIVAPDDEEFKKMVEKAKYYIHEGDIFQVVVSRTFTVKTQAEPFNIYKALREINPSPYLFYIQEPEYHLIGSSPERLVSVKNGKMSINPLAGTAKRPPPEDLEKAEENLLNDPKEIAEHVMLVDLGRNDVGSISEIGSVRVTKLKTILRTPHILHISSEIEGKLKPECDALDAVSATLPAGTLSGAPKIRAMEIIDELEQTRRGIYGGAISYIGNSGNLDTCIAIRMILLKNGVATVRAGAGIVQDSDPQREADETALKAKAALEAIRVAEQEIV